ncbi:hypothetical protein M405DRAFT_746833 [Rhizopogon salebrosus TDB-379]|nr:hypothetical protein M405DRAFT_746833 [Rhizopogon salebrosus TDB-379]
MQLQEAPVTSSHNFTCAICMEEQPVDNAVELDCSHPMCRDCVRGHICSKIEEHRFPVLCPVCVAEQDDPPGVISGLLVRLIGMDERLYATWEEMELSQHSVLLHCRRCRRSVLVDKEEHQESQILACPLPNCTHRWCKACQQSITFGSPAHTCDGTSELDRLMKQKGWKYCPSRSSCCAIRYYSFSPADCKTPFQRNGGCRHMTCISPGCNTHFCYGCGECIIRSALRTEIEGAVTAHYNGTCRMFG